MCLQIPNGAVITDEEDPTGAHKMATDRSCGHYPASADNANHCLAAAPVSRIFGQAIYPI
jgi:hypothetical protein